MKHILFSFFQDSFSSVIIRVPHVEKVTHEVAHKYQYFKTMI